MDHASSFSAPTVWEVELTDPREALEDAGAVTAVVFPMISRPSIGKCSG
jgi:hypothetical protein